MAGHFQAKKVRVAGQPLVGNCDFAITGVCCADPKGHVQAYDLIEENRQWLICHNCLDRLLQSGRWVLEAKPANAPGE